MENKTRKPPSKVFKCGAIQAAVWLFPTVKDGKAVEIPSVRICKSRKNKETGKWEDTEFLYADDLPKVTVVVTEAYKYLRLKSFDPQNLPESSGLLQGENDGHY